MVNKKKKVLHIGLVDADLLCNGTRHPNLALLKIAGYLKDNGFVRKTDSTSNDKVSTYVLLTNDNNFEDLKKLYYIYVSCVFSFTLTKPSLLLTCLKDKSISNKVHIGGTGSYANLSIEEGFLKKNIAVR